MRRNLMIGLTTVMALCTWCSYAQPVEDDLPQITRCVALTNARVMPGGDTKVSREDIIIRNGLIVERGIGLKIPPDAYLIPADSFYIYPAFIDALSYIGIKEPESESGRGGGNRERPPVDEEGNPALEAAGITPFKTTQDQFDPKEKSMSDWRSKGFAITHVVPRGRMIPGRGAIAVLSGKETDQILWKENVSMFGQWQGAGGAYPATIIGVMAKWRELYQNATQAIAHQTAHSTAAMVPRPQYHQAHEALIPLVKKEIPLFFRTPRIKDMYRALDLQQDLGMRMVLSDAEEAYMMKEKLKAMGIPLVLSLDLPEEIEEKAKAETKGVSDSLRSDSIISDPEKENFIKRRTESLKAHWAQAGELANAGISFSFSTMSGKPGDFFKNMHTMIENGLHPDDALKSLTVIPARLLGIEKYCGSIAPGQMANLIVSTKPVFEKEAAIRYMIVEGQLYHYDAPARKKKESKEEPAHHALLEGKWDYEIDVPDQKRIGQLTFERLDGRWNGTITSSDITTGNKQLDAIVFDGKEVSFTFDHTIEGQPVVVEFDLLIKEEFLSGIVHAGAFGTFPITGTRSSPPDQQ